jgi:hypothetical protein
VRTKCNLDHSNRGPDSVGNGTESGSNLRCPTTGIPILCAAGSPLWRVVPDRSRSLERFGNPRGGTDTGSRFAGPAGAIGAFADRTQPLVHLDGRGFDRSRRHAIAAR